MPLTPAMANLTTNIIPTISRLATTTSLTPLPTTMADEMTRILTGSCLMTIGINYTILPLTTFSYATKFNPDRILTENEDNNAPNFLYNSKGNIYDHIDYQWIPYNNDDDPPRWWSLPWTLSLPSCAQWRWWRMEVIIIWICSSRSVTACDTPVLA